MKPFVTLALCAAILAAAGSAPAWAVTSQSSKARAQANQSNDIVALTPFSASDSYISDQTTTFGKSKVYQFDLKGKWGLKFDVNQPESRPSGLNDVDAGAFYKLSPSLRVGVAAGFGEKTEAFKPEPSSAAQANTAHPRVRLETTFKF
ncbi:NtrZ family periplasmic regulatory protein [Asticcacaulis solisilvae]|uniref:NtrZ family periplasmic regulatory protein n=1 Tax=Asticcacaulis solisilvae TaxID=1217274 RepID=UPI003FD74CFC